MHGEKGTCSQHMMVTLCGRASAPMVPWTSTPTSAVNARLVVLFERLAEAGPVDLAKVGQRLHVHVQVLHALPAGNAGTA